MAYKSANLTTKELHQVKHLMGGVLALLSYWSLLSLNVQSEWLIACAMAAILFGLLRPGWVSRIPPLAWRVAAPALLVVVGLDFLLHLPEFIPSLVRMIVWILLYRNLAPRRQREDLQLILLCLFCLVLSGVMTVSLLFAFQILLFTPLAMALLFVINLLDRGNQVEAHTLTWSHFSWVRLIRRVISVLDWRVLSLGTVMFGFVVTVSTLLFILMPRFDLDQAIPFMQVQTQPLTGFSEEVALGDVTSVLNDNSVAIRIDLPSREALTTRPYWRMLVLDHYHDGTFRMSNSLNRHQHRTPKTERELRPDPATVDLRRGESWTFFMQGGISRYLPVPGDYTALRFQRLQEIEVLSELHVYSLDKVGQNVFSYQIEDLQFNDRFSMGRRESQVLEETEMQAVSEASEYPMTTLELDLRQDDRAALAEINSQLLAGRSLSVAEYSRELTELLWENFDYSLSPDGQVGPLSGGDGPDPVVHWLTEGSVGHCELFASAFVLLARDAGFPARLVVGFTGGSWNSVEDYFVIRNRDAHAWVEVLDLATQEWVRVDPTPGAGLETGETDFAASLRIETGWGAWADSLRIQWYRRIVNFEQQDQIDMAESLKEMMTAFSEDLHARLKSIVAEVKAWLAQPFSTDSLLRGLLFVFLLGGLYLIWYGRYMLMGLVFRLLRRPQALDPVRRQASRYLQRLRRVRGDAAPQSVVQQLQALRFGPEVSMDHAKKVFAQAQKALRRNGCHSNRGVP